MGVVRLKRHSENKRYRTLISLFRHEIASTVEVTNINEPEAFRIIVYVCCRDTSKPVVFFFEVLLIHIVSIKRG